MSQIYYKVNTLEPRGKPKRGGIGGVSLSMKERYKGP